MFQEEEEGDGSGSLKDFRNKMWRLAKEEEEDTWVPYEWKEDQVSEVQPKGSAPSLMPCRTKQSSNLCQN
jgi:hypothetical protein